MPDDKKKDRAEKKAAAKEAVGEVSAELRALRKKVAASVAEAASGQCQRLEAVDPKKAIAVIEALAMHGSLMRVKKEFMINHDTIRRIAKHHKAVIGDWREYAAGEAFLLQTRVQALMHKKMDRMEEDEEQIDKTNIRDFAQAAKMSSDNYLAAMGEGPKANGSITINVGPTLEDIAKHHAELKAKIAARMRERGDVVDI